MNIYGQRVLEALPDTLVGLAQRTGFAMRYILSAIIALRAEGYRITAIRNPDEPTTFEKGGPDAE